MFKIAEYDLVSIGRNGSGSIDVKVEGFWSSNPITLYIHRYWNVWTVKVSNSSGGRDTEKVESDVVAYKNYAAALTAMCDLGVEIQKEFPKMEAAYQVQREEYRQEREAKMAAEQNRRHDEVLWFLLFVLDKMMLRYKAPDYTDVYNRSSAWAAYSGR